MILKTITLPVVSRTGTSKSVPSAVVKDTWQKCDETSKWCINCEGNHSTMAMTCGKKEIINKKRKEEKEGTFTYTEDTKKSLSAPAVNQGKVPTPDTHITIIQCMYHAHFENLINPGSYEKALNEMFKANNLLVVKVPTVPQKHTKFTEAMNNSTNESTPPQPIQTQQTEQCQQAPQASEIEQPQGKRMESEAETEKSNQTPEHSKCKKQNKRSLSKVLGTEIGLRIYTTKKRGWAEVPLRQNSLKGIEDKIIKWSCTDASKKEKEIMEKLVFGLIDLADCFLTVSI